MTLDQVNYNINPLNKDLLPIFSSNQSSKQNKLHKISQLKRKSYSVTNSKKYKIGETVRLTKNRYGIIKYIGKLTKESGIISNEMFYGIELKGNSKGENSGYLNGYKYFECENELMGIFVKENQIIGYFKKKKTQSGINIDRNIYLKSRNKTHSKQKKKLKNRINEISPNSLKIKLIKFVMNNPNFNLQTSQIIKNMLS